MFRLFLALLPVVIAGPSWAEWEETGADASAVFYVDRATLVDDGEYKKISMLLDYKTARRHVVESALILEQIDCGEQRARSLHETFFTWPMAYGKPIGFYAGRGEWQIVKPETIEYKIFSFACRR